jgi:Restriction endonuclease
MVELSTMPTPKQTGDALHNAVRAIERSILVMSPSLKQSTFFFEDKKVIIVDGVRHEIDIFVTIRAAPGYDSVHIFECKNWRKSVGKTEILDFSAKVKAVNAAHGYFVAKSFTRYAKAQAKQDGRITLLTASQHDPAKSLLPHGFHAIAAEATHADITFYKRSDHANPYPCDLTSARLNLPGTSIALQDYIRNWVHQTKDGDVLSFASHSLPEGRYDREACSTRKFAAGEFLLNGEDMEMAAIFVRYHVDLYRPAVVSHFEVETRGRVYSLAPINLPQEQVLTIRLVEGPEVVPKS